MNGFGSALHAEWTKFRTVRGWVVGMAAAVTVVVGLGLTPGLQGSCGRHGPESACVLPVGPDGQEVTDSFTFVHQPLAGDGSITVRVSGLTSRLSLGPDGGAPRPVLVPWAKAGLVIKDGTRQGSTYAAIMMTGGHGVRMQHDYAHDVAGPPAVASAPCWLRLTRAGDTIRAEASTGGEQWTTVGTVRLAGLPPTVQAGMFVTSPQYAVAMGAASVESSPSLTSATFDRVDRQGAWAGPAWTGERIGGSPNGPESARGGYEQIADGFTVSGSGDIAPAVAGAAGIGTTITQTLAGTFGGLIIMVVIGAMFATAEYRRGLIRTTLAAHPRRDQVLAAKAVVIGAVTFVAGLVAASIVVGFGTSVLRDNGVYVHPATTSTELRLVLGTAALLAVAAVLALALGTLLRRGTTAVTTAFVAIVLPYLLALSVLPAAAAQWLLRITPAAAFALQQASPEYAQVDNVYTPAGGYFPLSPWAGFAVLAGWTVLAMGLAMVAFRRRDA